MITYPQSSTKTTTIKCYTVDMNYNLPKPYLSYSAIESWLKYRADFRRRYYEQQEMIVTPELAFGKKIGELLENHDESLSHIKQYVKPEQKFNVEIDGVKLFGFIDSFNPETNSFYEFKTGRTPWTQGRVDKHLQLPIYSVAIEEMFGTVTDECELIWMETRKVEKQQIGLLTHRDAYGIELTGKVREFKRTITKEERQATRELVVTVAKEISDDYTEWQKAKAKAKANTRANTNGFGLR